MRNPFLFLSFLSFLVIPCIHVSAQVSDGDPLQKLRTQFENEVIKLDTPLVTLNQKYRSYLKDQKSSFQKAGNLRGVLAVDEELKTFESSPAKEPSSFPELKRLEEIYREQKAEAEKNSMSLKRQLIRSYQKTAANLAAEWTKAGNIEQAKLALAESDKFAAMEKDPSLLKALQASERKGREGSAILGRWIGPKGWGAEFLVNGEAKNITAKGAVDITGTWKDNADGTYSASLGKKGQWKWKISLKGDTLYLESFQNGKRFGKKVAYSKQEN